MLLLVIALILVLAVARGAGILASAIEIGEDEHYEVSKAMLWARGYPLYTKVWNDQPPLYTDTPNIPHDNHPSHFAFTGRMKYIRNSKSGYRSANAKNNEV